VLALPARISGSPFLPPEFLCGFPPLPWRLLLLPGGNLREEEGLVGWKALVTRPVEMAGVKEPIEVKFRLSDGTDIGPSKYDPNTTVAALKEFVLARWPQGGETCRVSTALPPLLLYLYTMCSLRLRCVYIQLCYVDACCFGRLLVPLSCLYPFGRLGTRNAILDHGSSGLWGWSC
jgi:hypothetical protein